MALGVGTVFFGTLYSAAVAGVLVGVASGAGFTFAFSAARAAYKGNPEYQTLSVSMVNSFALIGDFVPALLFSYLVMRYGYSPAWLYTGLLTFVLMVPILFQRAQKQTRLELKSKIVASEEKL